jgi:hypothetical protein
MFPEAHYDDRDRRILATALIDAADGRSSLNARDSVRALELTADVAADRGVAPHQLPLLDLPGREFCGDADVDE